jgi:hypothetical protein
MATAAHSISRHIIHADGISGGGDTNFSASYSGALIKRPRKQDITVCSTETLHVYVIRGTFSEALIKFVSHYHTGRHAPP